MSRKKFTDGWESLFETTTETAPGETGLLFELPEPTLTAKPKAKLKTETAAKHSGKSFASDLESFLQEAFEESFAEQTRQHSDSEPAPNAKTRRRPPSRGLDALIRSTIEPENLSLEHPGAGARRLVLFLDEQKIFKLKSIARTEKTLLRNIVDQIVAEFIAEYERRESY